MCSLISIHLHTHNDHITISIFCNKNKFIGRMTHLRNLTSVFQIPNWNNLRHTTNSFVALLCPILNISRIKIRLLHANSLYSRHFWTNLALPYPVRICLQAIRSCLLTAQYAKSSCPKSRS